MTNCRTRLLGCAALSALFFPEYSLARTLAPSTNAVSQANDATAQQREGDGDADIIVTAQRRSEKLKDVPISIAVLDSETLSRTSISSTLDLGNITPGLNVATNGGFANPTIRGVGTSVTATGAEANVAVYVDGIYRPNQLGNLFDLNNVANVQVLKGPQGTLFGRNATGGAILVTTLDPEFSFSGKFDAGYGSYDEVKLGAYVTAPLTDTVAFNVAASYKDDDGYQFNKTTGHRVSEATTFNARGKLLWNITPNLKAIASGFYVSQQDSAFQARQAYRGNNSIRQTQPNFPLETQFGKVALDTDPNIIVHNYGGSLALSLDTEKGAFKSITSYEYIDPYSQVDVDSTSLPTTTTVLAYPEKTFTQELSFSSKLGGPLQFVVGGYYFDTHVDRDLRTSRGLNAPAISGNDISVGTKAGAAFGELTFDVTSRLKVIGGVRYSTETKDITGANLNAPVTLNASRTWNAWTPRAAATYKLSDVSTGYASFSRGFKSGVFDSTLSATPIEPEYISAYEIGFKHFGPGFRFEASTFYYDYTNLQVQVSRLVNGAILAELRNAANARIYGADASLWLTVAEGFKVQLGAGYTNARYRDFPTALLTTPRSGGGNRQSVGDASGKKLIRTPEISTFATLDYRKPLQSGSMELSVTPSFTGSYFWDPGNNFKEPSRFILNAQLSWVSDDEKFRASIWGKNLTNEHNLMTLTLTTGGASAAYARPLTIGASLSARFGAH